jgi:hypothetical protein
MQRGLRDVDHVRWVRGCEEPGDNVSEADQVKISIWPGVSRR